MEAREGCRLPFLVKLPRRLPGCCCLVVTSFSSDALAKRGLGVLNIVRFSLHRALSNNKKQMPFQSNFRIIKSIDFILNNQTKKKIIESSIQVNAIVLVDIQHSRRQDRFSSFQTASPTCANQPEQGIDTFYIFIASVARQRLGCRCINENGLGTDCVLYLFGMPNNGPRIVRSSSI